MLKRKKAQRPAKSPRQCDRCIWRDGMDSSVNEVCQGLGLCSADSSGDVSVVQESYRERSTWLLVCRPAINHSNLLQWGVGKWGVKSQGKLKVKVKCDLIRRTEGGNRLCTLRCRHKRIWWWAKGDAWLSATSELTDCWSDGFIFLMIW